MSKFNFDPHPGKFATVQEACNYAYLQLLKQGEESSLGSLYGSSVCKYRTSRGTKCFLGHIWPDETYDEQFEGKSFHPGRDYLRALKIFGETSLHVQLAKKIENAIATPLTVMHRDLLREFQLAHDTAGDDSLLRWVDSFKIRADKVFARAGWPVPSES